VWVNLQLLKGLWTLSDMWTYCLVI
jgi:hypothetical protein